MLMPFSGHNGDTRKEGKGKAGRLLRKTVIKQRIA